MMRPSVRILALASVALAALACWALGLGDYLSLDQLRASREALQGYADAHPVSARAGYVALYVGVTSVALPWALALTLAGGAIFGLAWGTLLVSVSATAGATVAFLLSRYVLGESVQRRFGARLAPLNEGFRREGGFYLLSLRMVPLVPYFLVNILMGLTPIRAQTYVWVSFVGMLPSTAVFVNAGTELGQINSLSGILSPGMVCAFAAVGVLPLLSRWALRRLRRRPGH
ncbi:MAG: TVP38/TMEM64 family protein [Bdellovibrionales bacterium]|nr:TVP38/TMEM64 family protein [Bdellovibrionales bacterium]